MFKHLGVGAAALVLLAPGAAVIGVAVLIAPSAAGSAGCVYGNSPAGSAAITGTIPTTLTATTTKGASITLDHAQLEQAAVIIAVGNSERISSNGQLVALMAAFTEAKFKNLANPHDPASTSLPNDGTGTDHDSVGLFQMRPSAGWGTAPNLMDPTWASRAFYGGPAGPNHGSPRGLLDIPGWSTMDPGAAAQTVEGSAYPDRYAVNEPVAQKVLTALTGVTLSRAGCSSAPGGLPTNLPPGFAGAFITAAASQIGVPYVWGGGSYTGPTGGGYDCTGLIMYAAYVASKGHIRLAHYAATQEAATQPIAWSQLQPGDLIYFTYPGASGPHHAAIYLGTGRILQAPRSGETVRYGTLSEFAGQDMAARRLS